MHAPSLTGRIAVLGDALLDITVAPAQPLVERGDVPATIRIGPGGQGANVAVRLARRGVDVTLACGLAGDPAGTMLRAALAAEGIRVVGLDVDRTGTVVVLLAADAERSMLSQRPDIARASVPAIDRLGDVAWLVVSGYLLLETDAPELADRVAVHASRRAVLGCSLRPEQAGAWADAAARIAPDLVVLNRDEAATLVGEVPEASAVARRFDCLAVVTGRDAAAAALPDGPPVAVPAVAVEAIDATGAGDAFAAALMEGLATVSWPPGPDDLVAALTAAAAAGGAVAGVHGAQGRIPGERGTEAAGNSAGSDTLPA